MGNTCSRKWHDIVSVVEHHLESVFYKWGILVTIHPLKVIVISLLIGGLMCAFIPLIPMETETINLFAPTNTVSYENYENYEDTWAKFEDTALLNSVIMSAAEGDGRNVLTPEYLSEFQALYDEIAAITVSHQGEQLSFVDLCFRLPNGNCEARSVLELFNFNQTQLTAEFETTQIRYPVTFSEYRSDDLFVPLAVGGDLQLEDEQDASTADSTVEVVKAAPALQLWLLLDENLFDREVAEAWYVEFIKLMESYDGHDKMFLSYEGFDSFDEELNRSIVSDVNSFIIGFVVLFTFSAIVVSRFKRVGTGNCFVCDGQRTRARIALAGVTSAMLAVGSSFGLVGGIFRIKFNSVVTIAPFLLIGLGLDDMFVLVRSYELTPSSHPVSERIALTMQRGGLSILFTSVTDLVAFSIGSSSSFGSVSAFCIYCGVGVFLDFLFQVSFFLGFMVYDSYWAENPSCSACCAAHKKFKASVKLSVKQASTERGQDEAKSEPKEEAKDETKEKAVVAVEMQPPKAEESAESAERAQTAVTLESSIEPQSSSAVMRWWGHFLLSSWLIKSFVLVVFAVYLAIAIWGVTDLTAFVDQADLSPNDSYLRDHYAHIEKYFSSNADSVGPTFSFTLDKSLDYSSPQVFATIDELLQDLRDDDCFVSNEEFQVSWIHHYRDYLDETHGGYDSISKSEFYRILYQEFLVSDQGLRYQQDIWDVLSLDQGDTYSANSVSLLPERSFQEISRSRVKHSHIPIGTGSKITKECLPHYKRIQSKYQHSLGLYYFMITAVFAESDLVTINQTVLNLVYAVGAAFLITIILIPYPLMSVVVLLTVAQIMVGVLGFMSLWGLDINTTTMINVVISVGFSVDNAAHICHAFMTAPLQRSKKGKLFIDADDLREDNSSNERYLRVMYALDAVGIPIVAGDITTLLALLPLLSAQSEIFSSFFKCLMLVLVAGAGHAIIYLPVLLSICGPLGFDSHDDKSSSHAQQSQQSQQSQESQQSQPSQPSPSQQSQQSQQSQPTAEPPQQPSPKQLAHQETEPQETQPQETQPEESQPQES